MNVYGCSSFSLFLPFCVCVFTYCHYDEYTLSYRISLLCLFARVTSSMSQLAVLVVSHFVVELFSFSLLLLLLLLFSTFI